MRSFSILSLACFLGVASGFAPATPFLSSVGTHQKSSNALALFAKQTNHNNDNVVVQKDKEHTDASASATSLVSLVGTSGLLWSLSGTVASAAGPDWGLFEGRTGSLLHPVMMGGLVLLSAYTALLGFQWRRQRTLGDEIQQLKKQLPALSTGESVASALEAAQQADEVDPGLVATLKQALVTQAEIQTLTDERKELVQLGPRDKHYNNGAVLAFLGTAFAIEGPLNTYARAGKLFPGPHLYAGAGLVVCWAAAVACVPFMQKGNDTARSLHVGANVIGLGLFGWQIVSGLPILFKVLELTKWP